jgi:hypothetical protein
VRNQLAATYAFVLARLLGSKPDADTATILLDANPIVLLDANPISLKGIQKLSRC